MARDESGSLSILLRFFLTSWSDHSSCRGSRCCSSPRTTPGRSTRWTWLLPDVYACCATRCCGASSCTDHHPFFLSRLGVSANNAKSTRGFVESVPSSGNSSSKVLHSKHARGKRLTASEPHGGYRQSCPCKCCIGWILVYQFAINCTQQQTTSTARVPIRQHVFVFVVTCVSYNIVFSLQSILHSSVQQSENV